MKHISKIWLVFTILFLILSLYHFWQSRTKLILFWVDSVPDSGLSKNGVDLFAPFKAFLETFNLYITHFNKINFSENIITGIGYLVSSIIAFLSFMQSKYEAKKYSGKENKPKNKID